MFATQLVETDARTGKESTGTVVAVAHPCTPLRAAPRLPLGAFPRATAAHTPPVRASVKTRPGARVYRRRRAVAGAALAAAAVAFALPLGAALAGSGGGPLTTRAPGVPFEPAVAHVHLVQPGETLWSIVHDSGVRGDPRPEVDRLAAQLGGHPLQAGQLLQLP
jgi:hypothetical protein